MLNQQWDENTTVKTRQVAFITGGARGIGFEIAAKLAQAGFDIALNDYQDSATLQASVARLEGWGVNAVAIPGDVADISLHDRMLARAENALGPLTTFVNNAGVSVTSRGDLLDVTPESYDRCQAVNARATFFLCQAFARRLLARTCQPELHYSLIVVSSSNASAASINRGEYCVSKAGAAMVAKLFAARLAQAGVQVFDIQPGLIVTEMTQPSLAMYQQRVDEGLTLLPELGTPAQIGTIVTTLASGGMPYLTGQVISADGGMLVPRF